MEYALIWTVVHHGKYADSILGQRLNPDACLYLKIPINLHENSNSTMLFGL